MHFVYILEIAENREWYIGQTDSLERRLKEHERLHPGHKLIYYEAYNEKKQATQREQKLKQFGGSWRALKRRLRGRGAQRSN